MLRSLITLRLLASTLLGWCVSRMVAFARKFKPGLGRRIALRIVTVVVCTVSSGIFTLYHPGTAHAALDPAASEYMLSMGPITGSTTGSVVTPYTYASIVNPIGSGKTFVIKRVRINSDAVAAAATYQDLSLYRVSTVSAGTLISGSGIPKKNTDSIDSKAEARYGNVTATIIGNTDSRIMSVVAASAIGNANGGKDVTFNSQQLILRPGHGITLSQIAGGDVDQRIRMAVEWEEVNTAPYCY